MNRQLLGIDFGTTRTVVSAAVQGNYPLISFVDRNGDAREWYPSVIAVRNEEVRYGLDALEVSVDPEWSVVKSFKRWLSMPEVTPESPITVGELTQPVQQWLNGFLTALKRDLIEHSNLPMHVTDLESLLTVIATPANARSAQRMITLEAFNSSGFEVSTMLNEPSAAGIEYAFRHRTSLNSRRERVLVYDLGGGTFDASLVRMQARRPEVVASGGVARLGGDDFDDVLVDMTLEQVGIARGDIDPPCLEKLRLECRDQKERLHPNTQKMIIDLEQVWGDDSPEKEVRISTKDYYARCQPLIEQSIQVTKRLLQGDEPNSLEKTSQMMLTGVAGLYVVGGASSLPAVARQLRERFGHRVHRSPYLSGATSIGLAVAGDKGIDLHISDRFTRTFGVFRELQGGRQVSFDAIFVSGTRLPAPGQEYVTAIRRYRSTHNVGHFRYVECDGVSDSGQPIGIVTPYAKVVFPFSPSLRGVGKDLIHVPVQRMAAEQGVLIEEKYQLDDKGLVHVTITNLEDGYARAYDLNDHGYGTNIT